MPDINREASEFWAAMKPMIDEEIKRQTQGMVQRRKAKVTTAPSLATNTIGVTEPFGSEMFVPFTTNLISATVGDVVWVEFMYGATNAFASMFASVDDKDWSVAGNLNVEGNETVGGTLIVTNRNAYGTLAGAGWYRIFTVENYGRAGRAWKADICITRTYRNQSNELHSIKLLSVYDSFEFVDEVSKTNNMLVDKIRYTRSGTVGHVDIHYTNSLQNEVSVDYSIYTRPDTQSSFTTDSLSAVADSPSGETVLTEYTFNNNTDIATTTFTPTSGSSYSTYSGCYYERKNGLTHVHIGVSGLTANTTTTVYTLPSDVRPSTRIASAGLGGTLPLTAAGQIQTSGVVQINSTGTYAMLDWYF